MREDTKSLLEALYAGGVDPKQPHETRVLLIQAMNAIRDAEARTETLSARAATVLRGLEWEAVALIAFLAPVVVILWIGVAALAKMVF